MNLDEYAEEQRKISAETAAAAYALAQQLQAEDEDSWGLLVLLLYYLVQRRRDESARLARRFFDSEREQHRPGEYRLPVNLPRYELLWLHEALEPERQLLDSDADSGYVSERISLRAVKEVENAGRRVIIRAVEDDNSTEAGQEPAPEQQRHSSNRRAVAWARVPTGRETCAFCWMLVSRGPVYTSESAAGGNNLALDELMTKWHTGCDCKVVPVYDKSDWPGMDRYKLAEDLWGLSTGDFTGRAKINAFRRAYERPHLIDDERTRNAALAIHRVSAPPLAA